MDTMQSATENTKNLNQISNLSKDDFEDVNAPIPDKLLMIWLDNRVDEDNKDHQQTINQLRDIVNTVESFTDVKQCINFLTNVHNEKVFMVISGELCLKAVPLIHDISQLYTIVIFCDNKTKHEQWAKQWPKIKGIFTEILPMRKALEQAAQLCEQNAISISFLNTSDDISNKKLDQLDPSFMYTQILKEILLTIEFEKKHKDDFINYCRTDEEGKFNNVSSIEQNYDKHPPIRWYTSEIPLYSRLNHVLRHMNVNGIIKMGYFIRELYRDIEQLHSKQFNECHSNKPFKVYRGQGLSRADFNKMIKAKGGLMSFNSFLSTSNDPNVGFSFGESNADNPDLIGTVFVMTIDPSLSTTPFASISEVSQYNEHEDEVLFSMQTVFRIEEIEPLPQKDNLFQVKLTLTSDDDKDIRVLTDCIREETFPEVEGWRRLALLLQRMGQAEKAQKVYEIILEKPTSDLEKAIIYNQLGLTKCHQAKYEEAMNLCEKALEICQNNFPNKDIILAKIYNNIGGICNDTGKYLQALSYYEKTLEIYQRLGFLDDSASATLYNNIGGANVALSNYSIAISYYEKALKIRQKSLTTNHPDLASSYNNIGGVYLDMGNYSEAVSSYKKALEIQQRSLPPDHPDLAASYNNIGGAYVFMSKYSEALSYYEKMRDVNEKDIPQNHPHLAASFNNIGTVHRMTGEFSEAFFYYQKALVIQKKSLPMDHPDFAASYHNIGAVYDKLGEYSEALSNHQKALEIQQQLPSLNHPHLATIYSSIGAIHEQNQEYLEALSYYLKALDIQQKSLPMNHPDFATSYNDIGAIYDDLCKHSEALTYHKKALQIQQQSLDPSHIHFATTYNNIAAVHLHICEYSEAHLYFEKALKILQQSLPPDHPDLVTVQQNITGVYSKM